MRELRQVGIELIGAEAPAGTVEVIELLVGALDAIGLDRAVVGLGDSDLFRQLLDEYGVPVASRDRILGFLATHDLVAIENEVTGCAEIGDEQRQAIIELSSLRGGSEVLARAREIGGDALARASQRLAETFEGLEQAGIADRVQLDLGLLRELGYYTGAMFEVYDPGPRPRPRRRRPLRRSARALRQGDAGSRLRVVSRSPAHCAGGGGAVGRGDRGQGTGDRRR